MVALGVAGLNLFLGEALLPFSVESPFLMLGLVSGSGCLNWLTSAGIIGPIFHLQESFHLLNDVRVQAEVSGPGHAPNQLGCSISFEDMCALH